MAASEVRLEGRLLGVGPLHLRGRSSHGRVGGVAVDEVVAHPQHDAEQGRGQGAVELTACAGVEVERRRPGGAEELGLLPLGDLLSGLLILAKQVAQIGKPAGEARPCAGRTGLSRQVAVPIWFWRPATPPDSAVGACEGVCEAVCCWGVWL